MPVNRRNWGRRRHGVCVSVSVHDVCGVGGAQKQEQGSIANTLLSTSDDVSGVLVTLTISSWWKE